MPNLRWGCGKEDNLREFSAEVNSSYTESVAAGSTLNVIKTCWSILAAIEGQNHFGEVVGP